MRAMVKRGSGWIGLAACVLLAGCGVQQRLPTPSAPEAAAPGPTQLTPDPRFGAQIRPSNTQQTRGGKIAEIYSGSPGAQARQAIAGSGPAPPQPRPGGDITLSFDDADIREVVQLVLRDLLNVNYIIDPDVRGTVTVRTGQPLTRDQLLPTLEAILEASNLALVQSGNVYRVSQAQNAPRAASGVRSGFLAQTQARGFTMAVFPLAWIGASEMGRQLEPVLPPGRVLRADDNRNVVVVAGNDREVNLARQTVQLFDVDQMAGQSVLIESLENVDVGTLALELDNVFGGTRKGPLAGQVRLIPLERMNAIMVVSRQPRYLDEARNWIARLDRSRNAAARRTFVYYVQNGKAANLVEVLKGVYPGEGGGAVAAGVTPVRAAGLEPIEPPTPAPPPAGGQQAPQPAPAAPPAATNPSAPKGPPIAESPEGVRIIADETNNAILILATQREYELISETLAKLDIVPLQVLIEANILEVTLRDQLRFGVQYFINTGGLGLNTNGFTALTTGANTAITPNFPGFGFTISSINQPRVVVDALSQVTDVTMLSAPQVMVLDNQAAKLQVGDQVPIVTQVSTSVVTADPRIVNSVQYRDTGVTLEVTPRVNASGLVTLEIAQEVSDVAVTTSSTINSPTISQRKILSTVAIRSGETVALGGLIRESTTGAKQGIPALNDIPFLGVLFGQTSADSRRTELLVLLTPRVVRNDEEARDATSDVRRKYQALIDMERGLNAPVPPRRFRW
jgi:general secretion pathway protein D